MPSDGTISIRPSAPPASRGVAIAVIMAEIEDAKTALQYFDIPVRGEQSNSKKRRAYCATCYNGDDLKDINVVANVPELLSDRRHLSAGEFVTRVHTGIREEVIHSMQIYGTRKRYEEMSAVEKEKWGNAGKYWRHLQGELFDEMAATKSGRQLLVAAGQIYYGNPSITTVKKLKQNDIISHGQPGYITTELVRQIIQARCDGITSEEGRGLAADKLQVWSMPERQKQYQNMIATIRNAAPDTTNISPLLTEIVNETQRMLHKMQDLQCETGLHQPFVISPVAALPGKNTTQRQTVKTTSFGVGL